MVAGCVNIKAPDSIRIGNTSRTRLDAAHVPATHDHEEARLRLGEAYDRIRYLERKVKDLKEDKRELKRERDACRKKYKELKERYED